MTDEQILAFFNEKTTSVTEVTNPTLDEAKAYVTSLFQAVLGRDPNATGLENIAKHVVDGTFSKVNFMKSALYDDPTDTTKFDYLSDDERTSFKTAQETAKSEADTFVEKLGEMPSLTTSDDSIVGTEKNDIITAASGTLGNNDVILDSTTTDADILNAEVTSAGATTRVQNIETININGSYVTTGMALTNVSGANTVNLTTSLQGGTATITDANSINAAKIVAGDNISTLKVTSLTSGTRDAVTVDGGSADVKLYGKTGGADKYDVTLAADKTLTLDQMDSSGDTITVTAAGDFTLAKTTAVTGANLALSITNNSADAITVTEADNGLMAKTVTLAGNAITINATDIDAVDGVAVTSSATSSTIKISDASTTGADVDLASAVVTNLEVAGVITDGTTDSITINSGSTLVFSKDTTATNGLTVNIDNAAGDLTTGTLLVNANASQTGAATGLTTGAKVDTLLITPGALDNDANGNAQTVKFGLITVDAATDNTIINGANSLTIDKFAGNSGDEIIVSTGLTGDLTISAFTQNTKLYMGSGDDSITANVNKVFEIHAGAGDDTIDLNTGTAAAAGSKVYGEAGNDTVTTSGNGDTVDLGAGDDTVTLSGGSDTITTGAGADTITAAVDNASTIKDFTVDTDLLVITGALTGNVDVANLSQTSSKYDIDGDGADDDITLTDVTATDLSNSIQFGSKDATLTVGANTLKAGAKDDYIGSDNASSSITTGDGADTVVVSVAGGTVADFTTGTDKIILTVAVANDQAIDFSSVTPTSGAYDSDGDGAAEFTLTDHTETDLTSMVQLGTSASAYDIDTLASAHELNAGTFDDFIDFGSTAANAQTVGFIDNNGMDTFSTFTTGTDKFSFDKITGITATSCSAATTARVSDASDGTVYVMDNTAVNSDTVDSSVLGTTVNNEAVTFTSDVFVNDVAGYFNNVLGTATGEKYVVALGGIDTDGTAGNTDDTLIYLVNGNSDGLTAADITLIGHVVDATVAAGDIA